MFTARQREKAGRERRKGEEARQELVEEQKPPSIPGLQRHAGMQFVSKCFGYFFFPSWQLWQLPFVLEPRLGSLGLGNLRFTLPKVIWSNSVLLHYQFIIESLEVRVSIVGQK